MDPTLHDWTNLLLRWFHMIAGIMWIGTSIFFHWLDNALERPDGKPEWLDGRLWMVHSGGFYKVEKVYLKPAELPPVLHWFVWEATFTWISGFCLLVVVYYLGDGAFLVDADVANLSHATAVLYGIGSLVAGLLAYDVLWRTPLGRVAGGTPALVLSFAGLVAAAWAYAQVFSGRAAFIHTGALMGTCMVANVWLHIVPSQKGMIEATRLGQKADWSLGLAAKTRSRHNHYMTYLVLFIMISNHFPMTYSAEWNWAVLAVLGVASGLVKYLVNVAEHGSRRAVGGALAVTLVGVGIVYAMTKPPPPPPVPSGPVAFADVAAVVHQRCQPCHSARPTDDVYRLAPNGVMMDTPTQIKGFAARIQVRAVDQKTMPLVNKTCMTQAERDLLGRWIALGARVDTGAPVELAAPTTAN
ncbi:MAG: hypothetical protein EXR79_05890 [Myxococcales bacterium]|nr:hypothetical protein [Myxococcales bacterium]